MTASTASNPLLEVDNIELSFGGIIALKGVSFEIFPHEVLGMIGPNGAGKTTIFNCLNRLYQPQSGDIRIEGKSTEGAHPYQMAAAGIGRTFQNIALFGSMTVAENVAVGSHYRLSGSLISDLFGGSKVRAERNQAAEKVSHILDLLGLVDIADHPISGLNFATQKKVEFARALVGEPKLLMLDEPAGGLNHEEVAQLGDFILKVRETFNIAVLLVEHHLGLVMRISDRVIAVDFGTIIASGAPQDVQNHPQVLKAYLGEDAA